MTHEEVNIVEDKLLAVHRILEDLLRTIEPGDTKSNTFSALSSIETALHSTYKMRNENE